jgi:hypothetical protein
MRQAPSLFACGIWCRWTQPDHCGKRMAPSSEQRKRGASAVDLACQRVEGVALASWRLSRASCGRHEDSMRPRRSRYEGGRANDGMSRMEIFTTKESRKSTSFIQGTGVSWATSPVQVFLFGRGPTPNYCLYKKHYTPRKHGTYLCNEVRPDRTPTPRCKSPTSTLPIADRPAADDSIPMQTSNSQDGQCRITLHGSSLCF